MNPVLRDILLNALLFAFIICCVVSAALQVIAASRHTREGRAPSPVALWRPEGRFDEVGTLQIHIARRLLVTGIAAYLLFGVLKAATG